MFDEFMTIYAVTIYELFAFAMIVPFWNIFKRAGFSGWRAVFILVPHIGLLICLSLLGLKRWPNEPENPPKKTG